ncbi:PLD nuclease N-terminal domain-containing protein [Roseibium aggregatum]|uniref:PLDc_N domain-containing protein n=1 Tax=Roseibium aggregatum TaxID=187304 RepID=A0A939EA54_9HYPH|nr:PLD nuclease N-terminal domain-containing protein [Roseibium aggregatum]MBN9669410.1 PLDc_N domain-containing protein [Roseibium aggregatum]
MEYGILGLIVLILDIYAVIQIAGSPASTGVKILWILGIVIFPIVGFLVWLLAGPRGSARTI